MAKVLLPQHRSKAGWFEKGWSADRYPDKKEICGHILLGDTPRSLRPDSRRLGPGHSSYRTSKGSVGGRGSFWAGRHADCVSVTERVFSVLRKDSQEISRMEVPATVFEKKRKKSQQSLPLWVYWQSFLPCFQGWRRWGRHVDSIVELRGAICLVEESCPWISYTMEVPWGITLPQATSSYPGAHTVLTLTQPDEVYQIGWKWCHGACL